MAKAVFATRFLLHGKRFPLHECEMQQKPKGVSVTSRPVYATSEKEFLLRGFCYNKNKFPLHECQLQQKLQGVLVTSKTVSTTLQKRFPLPGFCYIKTRFRYVNVKTWKSFGRLKTGFCYEVSVTKKQVSVTRTPNVAETRNSFGYLKNGFRYIAEAVPATRFLLHRSKFPLHERQLQQKPQGVLVTSKTVYVTSQKRFLLPGFSYMKTGFRYTNAKCSRNLKEFWLPQKRFPLHRRSDFCFQVSVT